MLAVDFRYDLTDDPKNDNDTENAAQNLDHGWAVPILEHFIESVLAAWPEQKVSILGFSVGPTIVRDALRRLHRADKKPFSRVKDLVLVAGSHHGVSTFCKLCGAPDDARARRLRARRPHVVPADGVPHAAERAERRLGDACVNGEAAFGQEGVCGGNKVSYTTLVMKDVKEGTLHDEFVSEGSSRLKGARNPTVELSDDDASGYFYNGLFKNHYGALRSEPALKILSRR